jgi:predicted acylesterase/phospholipase RssA
MGTDIDIVISGGSVEGLCDAAGFIKALTKDLNFTIKTAAASSAGAIVLGALSAGRTIDEIEDIILNVKFTNWVSIPKWYNVIKICKAIKNGYLSDGESLYSYLSWLTKNKTFNEGLIELHVSGTDVNNGIARDFNSINDKDMTIATALRISSSVPGCFKPQTYDGKQWFDGSIRSHYPVEMVPMSDRPLYGFVASHFNTIKEQRIRSMSGFFGTIMKLIDNSLDINVRYSSTMAKRQPHTVYHTGNISHGWSISKEDRKKLIENARISTIRSIGSI